MRPKKSLKGIKKSDYHSNAKIRNKELTKRLILDAASSIIRSEGIKAFGINKVANVAGRNKRAIYDYFGNTDGVLKAILKEADYFLEYEDNIENAIEIHKENYGKELISIGLKSHFDRFHKDKLLQEIGLLEIGKDATPFLLELAQTRERIGAKLLKMTDEYFVDTDVCIRTVIALMIGGINYLTLHEKNNGSTFCGINLNQVSQQITLQKTLEQITNWAYENITKSEFRKPLITD